MMNRIHPLLISLMAISLMLAACGDRHEQHQHKHASEEAFDARGRYVSTDMRGESISVVHETVPDVMNAMRMSFRIDDESVAAGLVTGDIIRFDMVRTESGWYARNIEVLPPDTELDLPERLRSIGLPE